MPVNAAVIGESGVGKRFSAPEGVRTELLSPNRFRTFGLLYSPRAIAVRRCVGGLSGQQVGWVDVDAGGGHLGAPKDALYHVDVYVQFAEEGSGCVARVVEPHVPESGPGENFLPSLPIDVGADRAAVRRSACAVLPLASQVSN
jgi:hypothetical protein